MDYLQQITVLRENKQPFVLATVVRIEKPTSAKPGAKAIITEDGELIGWIGGSCAEPTVKRESARSLRDGKPRLLRLCPPEKMGAAPQEGITELQLTCMSGGTMEIYIEPYLPPPHLLLIGYQSVISTLAVLAKALEYSVTVLGQDLASERFPTADRVINSLDFSQVEITSNTYVIVASHGNYDEPSLEAVLSSRAAYIGLVSSRKRAESVKEYLREDGFSEEQIARIKNPAGLDIGAANPQEIAVSILAEIVSYRRQGIQLEVEAHMEEHMELYTEPETAIDPICNMTVEIDSAQFKSDYQGQTYYFCSAHCLHTFEKEPQKYASPAGPVEQPSVDLMKHKK